MDGRAAKSIGTAAEFFAKLSIFNFFKRLPAILRIEKADSERDTLCKYAFFAFKLISRSHFISS
jgi:hypothetical protein